MTTRQVYDQLERAGLAANARAAPAAEGPIGRCGERLEFDIPGAPAGASGVILICPGEFELNVGGNASLYRNKSIIVLVTAAPKIAPRIGEEVGRIQE